MQLAFCPLDASGVGQTIEVSLLILAFVELLSVGGTVVLRIGLLLALDLEWLTVVLLTRTYLVMMLSDAALGGL